MDNTSSIRGKTIMTGIISLVALVVFVSVIVYMAQRNNGQMQLPLNTSVETVKEEGEEQPQTQGTLGLRMKGSDTEVKNGSSVTVFIYADTPDDQIVAYDAVLMFDAEQLEYTQVRSLVDGMDIYQTVEEMEDGTSELIVTGVQSISQQEPFSLTNTALAEVTFTVLQPGDIALNLTYEPGSTLDSNLMNTKTQDILNNVVNVQFSAQ